MGQDFRARALKRPNSRGVADKIVCVCVLPPKTGPRIDAAYLHNAVSNLHTRRSLELDRSLAQLMHTRAHSKRRLLHRARRLEQVQFFLFRLHHRAPVDVLFDYFRF